MTATVVPPLYERAEVTPCMAGSWLALGTQCSRRLNPQAVERFADVMRRGAWEDDRIGGAVTVGADRVGVVSGHRRLHAVVAAGVTVPMMIRFQLATLTHEQRVEIKSYTRIRVAELLELLNVEADRWFDSEPVCQDVARREVAAIAVRLRRGSQR